MRIDRAGLAANVRVFVSLLESTADGAADRRNPAVTKRVSADGFETIEFQGVPPGTYIVRATATGRRTASTTADVDPGATSSVDLGMQAHGGELVVVLPAGTSLSRTANVTAQRLGAGVRGDSQIVTATPADREVRFGGLGSGRYLIQFWDTRSGVVIDMTHEPLCRVVLPPPPSSAPGSVAAVVRAMRGGKSEERLTVAWIRGRVTALEPGLWMNCADSPARFASAPGTYTAAVIDGVAGKAVGIPSGVRLHTIELAVGETRSVDVPLD